MKLQLTIITIGLISTNLLFSTLPTQAQSSKQTSKCEATIQSVKHKITKGRKVKVPTIFRSDIPDYYQNIPKNRAFRYSFGLRGAETENVLNSTQLLSSLSRDIFNNCHNISQVIFGIHETDAVMIFGLMPGNKVSLFDKCLDPGSFKKLPWGYDVCI
jgi:hypothetical protein